MAGVGGNPRGRGAEADNAERVAEAARMRMVGRPWAEIAKALGWATDTAAHQAVIRASRARIEAAGEVLDDLRAFELEKLDLLEREIWDVLGRGHVTVSQGRVVTMVDPDGVARPLPDDEWTMKAVDRLLSVAKHRAKLTGIEAPQKVDQEERVSVTYQYGDVNPDALK